MSDQDMSTADPTSQGKPPGKGKGKWLNAGVQAQQSADIEGLKAAFAMHIQDHEDAEPDAPPEGAPEDL